MGFPRTRRDTDGRVEFIYENETFWFSKINRIS